MTVLTGTKREITLAQWTEIIEKNINRMNNSMEGFRRFKDEDSLIFLIEDCEQIIGNAKKLLEVIEYMDINNID
jgi:DNA gyrase/topoisomerase IV subunit A